MPLPASAKLPLLFAAILGMCVLGADVFALLDLTGRRALSGSPLADNGAIVFVGTSALCVFVFWAVGAIRSLRFLGQYAREAAALPGVASKLTDLAKDTEQRVNDGAKVA